MFKQLNSIDERVQLRVDSPEKNQNQAVGLIAHRE
jgi:hypothetical protein